MNNNNTEKGPNSTPLPPALLFQATEHRLLGWDNDTLTEYLLNQGFSREQIAITLKSLDSDPIYKAASQIGQRFRKLESFLNIRHQLEKVSDYAGTIERRSNLSPDVFKEDFYSKNRPVIITDVVKNWAAFSKWSPQLFADTFGDEPVEVMTGRESDPDYEFNSSNHKSHLTMRQYIDIVQSPNGGNDTYMVANNHFLDTPIGKELLNDVSPIPPFLNQNPFNQNIFLWFGPAGTVTLLHHDEMNIFFAQVKGRKKVILISPNQTARLYNNNSVYSQVNPECPDLEKFPEYKFVQQMEFIIEPGEALFIPVGWWHHVRALDISISLSFMDFIYPNRYYWKNPVIKKD